MRLGQEKDFNDPALIESFLDNYERDIIIKSPSEISKIYTDVYEASNKERGKKYSAKISKSLEYYDFFLLK